MNANNTHPLIYSFLTNNTFSRASPWNSKIKGFAKTETRIEYKGNFYTVILYLYREGENDYYFINDELAIVQTPYNYYASVSALSSPLYNKIVDDFINATHMKYENITYVEDLSPIARIRNNPLIDICKYKLGKLAKIKRKKSYLQKLWDTL